MNHLPMGCPSIGLTKIALFFACSANGQQEMFTFNLLLQQLCIKNGQTLLQCEKIKYVHRPGPMMFQMPAELD